MGGYEYVIFGHLFDGNQVLFYGVTICQIEIKLYNPELITLYPHLKSISISDFMLTFLQQKSPYVPVYTKNYGGFQKVTFINSEVAACQRAFGFYKYF